MKQLFRFFSNMLLKIHFRESIKEARRLEASQWYPKEELLSLQWKRFEDIMKHAYENTGFYRRSFDDAGISPGEIKSYSDLLKIPVLKREYIKKNSFSMISKKHLKSRLIRDYSGGTSGVPVKFFVTKEKSFFSAGLNLRTYKNYGLGLGEPYALVIGIGENALIQKEDTSALIRKRILNLITLNAFDLSKKNMQKFSKKIIGKKPRIIGMYPSSGYFFAKYLKENRNDQHRPRAVFTISEVLTKKQRSFIEDVFECPVYNVYGCKETHAIAQDCPEFKNLHINAEHILVEVIKNGRHCRPGETGEILITDLFNYGMPLIRYRTGDVGSLSGEKCGCGRGLPLFKRIDGRIADTFFRADGTPVNGFSLMNCFLDVPGIDQFQVIQESTKRIKVKIKKSYEIEDGLIDEMKEGIRDVVGDVLVEFVFVDEIPLTKAGKFKFIVSNINKKE